MNTTESDEFNSLLEICANLLSRVELLENEVAHINSRDSLSRHLGTNYDLSRQRGSAPVVPEFVKARLEEARPAAQVPPARVPRLPDIGDAR